MKRMRLLAFALFLLSGIMLHAQQSQPGLYAGDEFQGNMDLYDVFDWLSANAQDGGNYTVVLETDVAASSSVLDYNGKSVTVSLKSSGPDVQVTYATRSPSSSLFTVKAGVTFVLEKGVALVGRPSASRPPVTVDGGNFIMNGGGVKDSKVDHDRTWFGGGVDLLRGTFTMNDGVISGNACGAGAGVNVGENTTFTMNGGIISGNIVIDGSTGTGFGGGVFVNKNATFTMNGGTISGNSAAYGNGYGGGGGVYVNGTFTMVDGIISDNVSNDSNGAGVCVSGNGRFVMEGGSVSNNLGTGVYLVRHESGAFTMAHTPVHGTGIGKFTMNGGIITGNSRSGVYINGASFTMNDGTISKNTASFGAGVYIVNRSSLFTMNGGAITENIADGSSYSKYACGGGGVCVDYSSKFTMNGGVISKNSTKGESAGGGGVFVDGTFTMTDGTISGNSATKSGGGVFVSGGSFIKSNTAGIIYGGDAADDKANKADQYGHAVYTKNGSRDTTARATMALDSKKYGAEGGWE
ncbi:MAG: right-handed parallel beta-helix repeat-containing protein [Treponemataceae bacterium]|nr:right-handed parallel beta-helix repeat-containing protein [Treponemataceae bacterium]